MATKVGGVKLDTRVLDKITAELKPRASRIINQQGLNMTGIAAQNAPVDTGALRNSLTENSQMTGDLTFTLQDGVEYGIFQELGTSKMAAQPFIIPALEAGWDKFCAAFSELFKA